MKLISAFILGSVFLSMVNCKTSKESAIQFQSTAPLEISAPYYNSWVAGVEGGGSGINVFLPLKENGNISIDSLHFRGLKTAVETRDKLIIGRFKQFSNQKKDLIMSSNPEDEYNNKLELKQDTSPFNLPQNVSFCTAQKPLNNNYRLFVKMCIFMG